MEEGEIACYVTSNFSTLPSAFSKNLYSRQVKSRPCLGKDQPFPKQALVFTRLQFKSFENTEGKGEIARNEQFLLFPQCFPRV